MLAIWPLARSHDIHKLCVHCPQQELCDKWAWVRWDFMGRPPRSEQQANADYELSVQVCVCVCKVVRGRNKLLGAAGQ